MQESEKITLLGIFLNTVLFIAKITAGLMSNSLAILSDAFNSLTDIVSYTAVYFAVKISNTKSDSSHPFGHRRAEPLASLIVAIFAGILGFEVLRSSVQNLISPRISNITVFPIGVLFFTMAVKTFMFTFFTKKGIEMNRPALRAAGIDSRNDVLVSGVALLGVVGYKYGLFALDSIAALIISMVIFYSGYKIGKENIDYLMGHAPPIEEVQKIRKAVKKIKGVKGTNEIKAHYVGNFIHIELHIEVDKNMTTQQSHDLGKEVERADEKFDFVDKAFIHIDPI